MKSIIWLFFLALFHLAAITRCDAASFQSGKPGQSEKQLEAQATSFDEEKIYLGDIIVYRREFTEAIGPFSGFGGRLWSGGRFVFEFYGQSETEQNLFLDACAAWTTDTGLQCVERTNEVNFARIVTHDGSGCGGDAENVSCSPVGRIGGAQDIQIFDGHWASIHLNVIIHEIGHAIGLLHEQSRSDRDSYVIINRANIKTGAGDNFNLVKGSRNHTDYDYESIMHYNSCVFSTDEDNCVLGDRSTEQYWTISPAPCALDQLGGDEVTVLDLEGVRVAYGGSINSIFVKSRRASCGKHNYSKSQVEATCGQNCSSSTPVVWNRKHEKYRWGCGFMANFNSNAYCVGRGQEYITEWRDKDKYVAACWGGTRVEHWTQCGCSIQSLNAQCQNMKSDIDAKALANILTSGSEREKHLAKLITFVEKLSSTQSLDFKVEASKNRMYLELAVLTSAYEATTNVKPNVSIEHNFGIMISNTICELKILDSIYKLIGSKISRLEIGTIFVKHGLEIPKVLKST